MTAFAALGGGVFINEGFDDFAIFAGPLLDAAEKLIPLTLDRDEVIMRKCRPLLLELALDDVPVAIDF